MSDEATPTLEYLTIELDKPRKLRLTGRALQRVELVIRMMADRGEGPRVDVFDLFRTFLHREVDEAGTVTRLQVKSMWGLHLFLWAALLYDDPALTVDEVADLVEAYRLKLLLMPGASPLIELAIAVEAAWVVGGLGSAVQDGARPNVDAEATASAH
jgi:hypothetical protein